MSIVMYVSKGEFEDIEDARNYFLSDDEIFLRVGCDENQLLSGDYRVDEVREHNEEEFEITMYRINGDDDDCYE